MDNQTIEEQLVALQQHSAEIGEKLAGFWQQLTVAVEGAQTEAMLELIEQIILVLDGLEGLQLRLNIVKQSIVQQSMEIQPQEYEQLIRVLDNLDRLHQESNQLLSYHDSLLLTSQFMGGTGMH